MMKHATSSIFEFQIFRMTSSVTRLNASCSKFVGDTVIDGDIDLV